MKNFKTNQKGITLIALIITIIVMLILVGVTVSVALNGGIFGKGEKAAFQTKASTIREQLELAKASRVMDNDGKPLSDYSVIKIGDLEGLDDKTREEYKDKIVVDKDGNICYDPAKVTDEEERTWLEEIGIKPYTGKKENETYTFTIGDLAKRGLLSSGEEDGPTVRGTKEEFFPETVSEELKNSEYIFNGFDTDDITIKVYNLTCSDKKYTNWLESEGGSIEANSFALYIMEGTIIFVITDENGDIINANNYENYKNLEFTISMSEDTVGGGTEPPVEELGDKVYGPINGYYYVLTEDNQFKFVYDKQIYMEFPKYEEHIGGIESFVSKYTQYQSYEIPDEAREFRKIIVVYNNTTDDITKSIVFGAFKEDDNTFYILSGSGGGTSGYKFSVDGSGRLNKNLTLEDLLQ